METAEQQEIVPSQLSEEDNCDLDALIGIEPTAENKNEPMAVVAPPNKAQEAPTLCRSNQIFAKTKPGWEPSLKGNKCHHVMTQLE